MKKRIILFFTLSLFALFAFAQDGYYRPIDKVGCGADLKNAIHNLIKEHTKIPYGKGSESTWGAFYSTDRNSADNSVYDIYSSEVRYFGKKGEAIDGMNIEHSLPKSWWGGDENNAYFDLHHLNPSDQEANSKKNNFPLAELESETWSNGVSAVGKATINGYSVSAFEPCDEYKGDFARIYMYMFTCYQDLTYKYQWMNYENSSYPTLKPWAVELLLKWNKQDPVSEREKARNNAVYAIQGNRNPYIDYPQLAEFVWGDSVNYVFNLAGEVIKGEDIDDDGGAGEDGDGSENTSGFSTEYFSLVTDASLLSAGDSVIFVYSDFAMGAQSGNYRTKVDGVTVSDGVLTSCPAGTAKFVLENGIVDGSFAFCEEGAYLSSVSSKNNYLHTLPELTAASSWIITIGEGTLAVIVAQGEFTRNYLQYNPSSPRFSCYKDTQKVISLYAKSPQKSTSVGVTIKGENELVDVYTMQGVCIKKNVSSSCALSGLPSGFYIVGDKKIYKGKN